MSIGARIQEGGYPAYFHLHGPLDALLRREGGPYHRVCEWT